MNGMSKALLTDLGSGKVYLLDGEASIGRSSDNKVVLADTSVSGHHATITCTGNAWYISDNSSRNGVEMNNFRIPSEGKLGLRDGCQLKMGRTVLRFTTDSEAIKQFAAQQNGDETIIRNNLSKPNSAGFGTGAHNTGSNSSRKMKKRGTLVAAISAAVIIVAVLTWCFANHSYGNKRMGEGDYGAAVSAYKKDFLFSESQYVEAALFAGEDAYAQCDYTEAIKYFLSAGDAGKERWSDALYEQAKSLIDGNEFDEAIGLLDQISNETRAQEQIGAASLAKARQQFSEGDIDTAIQTAQGIQNAGYANVVAFLDEVYHTVGNDLFAHKDYQGAREAYEKCEKDAQAQVNAAILGELAERDYYAAAVLADSSINNGDTDLSRKQWGVAFEGFIGNPNMTDINKALASEAAKVIIAGNVVFEGDSVIDSFRDEAPKGSMIGEYTSSSKDEYVISDLSSLYAECAQNPKGKILIVAQRYSYSERNQTQAVLFDLMRLLPSDCYPASLDEVEYIVVINYDYKREGVYTYVTVALQEFADVKVLRASDMRQLYKSQRVDGKHAPSSFSFHGIPPIWKSGNAPNMGEEIHAAISSIIG